MEQIMSKKIPTDLTTPNPQNPKDTPRSHNGGDRGFEYVSPWERLPDVIRRLTAGGRSKEQAQIDLCRAISDGAVNIRCKLKRHTRGFTSSALVEGKDFEIPTQIKPEDLDWEASRPLKPWFVRRGSYPIPGRWDLESIEVCRADVTKVLCTAKEQDGFTQHAAIETPASTSRPAVENQEIPVGSGRRSTVAPRKPGAAGLGRRRGVRPEKFERTKEAMRSDLQQRRLTVTQLEEMREKNLAARYGGVSRDTARKARNAVLSELNSRQIPDKRQKATTAKTPYNPRVL
jgi:hypothetical protein